MKLKVTGIGSYTAPDFSGNIAVKGHVINVNEIRGQQMLQMERPSDSDPDVMIPFFTEVSVNTAVDWDFTGQMSPTEVGSIDTGPKAEPAPAPAPAAPARRVAPAAEYDEDPEVTAMQSAPATAEEPADPDADPDTEAGDKGPVAGPDGGAERPALPRSPTSSTNQEKNTTVAAPKDAATDVDATPAKPVQRKRVAATTKK